MACYECEMLKYALQKKEDSFRQERRDWAELKEREFHYLNAQIKKLVDAHSKVLMTSTKPVLAFHI